MRVTGEVRLTGQDGRLTVEGLQMMRAPERRLDTLAAADVSGLATVATTGAYADLSGLPTLFSGAYADLSGIPATFAPSAHTHTAADVTDFSTAADARIALHEAAANPHPTYLTEAEGNALYAPVSVITSRFGHQMIAPAAALFIGNTTNATALSTAAQVANRTVIAPFVSGVNVTIDQIGCSISTFVASALLKCIIYASDSNRRPSTVLRETANIDAGSNGTKFQSITSLALTAGTLYWVGIRSSSTATVRTLGVGATPVLTYTNAATPVAQSTLILTETFANAAATWSYSSAQHSNVVSPLILMRVA